MTPREKKGKDPGGRFILPELIKGYAVTLREFFTRPTTMKYPEEKWTVAPRFRGYPKLVPNPDGGERCVACGLCAVVCPPQAIQLQAAETDAAKERYPVSFEIHMGRCINCGFCEEACPVDAIRMSAKYELNGPELDGLIYRKTVLLKDYFQP
jgi:NADH-quinone oxidoreductase subunit I